MNIMRSAIEWLSNEWLQLLIWFAVGLFVLPITLSLITPWVSLDRFYGELFSSEASLPWVILAAAPYALYLLLCLVRTTKGEPYDDTADEEAF